MYISDLIGLNLDSKLLNEKKMIKNISKTAIISAFIFIVTSCAFLKPDYVQSISPTELKAVMQNEDIFLVDVHTPQQQHIKGTDLFVPYNAIEKNKDKFPADKNAAIYLYCEGGPMGNAAARSLHDLGYSKIFNLDGGANAWHKAGFQFE